MNLKTLPKHYFFFSISFLCLFYLGFELFFNSYTILSVDEFWFAHRIYEYKNGLPYQDFSPYKTVLGYYLLLLPMQFSSGIFQTLITVKNFLALLNTGILLASAYWLTRFFSQKGIIISLALLLTTEIMLSFSTQIRIDLLAYWFCLFALLCLLEHRLLLAGFLFGIGFATSQKVIWYIFAANASLMILWLIYSRKRSELKWIIAFNVMIAAIIISYIAFWAWFSNLHVVLQNMFHDAAIMYELDWYDSARKLFWSSILLYNPIIFLMIPLTFLSVAITFSEDNHYKTRLFIIIFSSIVISCLIFYKQVFPYYMQVTIPVFFVLYAAFFSWLIQIFNTNIILKSLITRSTLWFLLILYSVSLIAFILFFRLPYAYLMTSITPILIGFYIRDRIERRQIDGSSLPLLSVIFFFMAIVYPSILLVKKIDNMDGAYQKAQISAMNQLLADGSDYVAGIELIYNKTQPISGMRHLMGPAIDYLYAPTKKLAKVMLASLYEDPNATIDTVLDALEKSHVKFYVNNYRMSALPPKIKQYLASHYQHWFGSIYLYSPTVTVYDQTIEIKFSGFYKVESSSKETITLNQHLYQTGATIYLQKGMYHSHASYTYRLSLTSDVRSLNFLFAKDDPDNVIF